MQRRTLVLVAALGVAAVGGGGYLAYTQVFGSDGVQAPEFGVADMGDWGEVTDERTEVTHTLWVDNPNPVGVDIGDEITLDYQVQLNGVQFANGTKEGIDVSSGNNTVEVRSDIQNENLPELWVRYVRADETIHYRLESEARIAAGLSTTKELPTQNGTALENDRPVIEAANQSVAATEGEYTRSVDPDDLPGDALPGGIVDEESVTVGYEVREARAEWGEVTDEQTTMLVHVTLHNPSETVIEPGVPDGLAFAIDVNDNRVLEADGEALSPRNVDRDDVLLPGETRTYTYEVRMDNERVDEWFTSHVRQGERSDVSVTFQLQFAIGDATITVPRESPITYDCQVQTGILVDGQETDTDCGGEFSGSPAADDAGATTTTDTETSSTTTAATTTTATTATTTTTSSRPTAVAGADPTEGDAPLNVTFDASGSSDPDGDVVEYVWRFGDGSSPARGEEIVHTYATPGTYTAEVTVVDSEGNQDTDTVEITVEAPTGALYRSA